MAVKNSVAVIGAGLAGSEAAWQLAQRGVKVRLFEQKPDKKSPAHSGKGFAELVCSNSLRADGIESAVGLLKQEMRELDSLVMRAADTTRVPAGGALAVDREAFSSYITEVLMKHENIEIVHGEVTSLPDEGIVIAAPGPLVEGALAQSIGELADGFLSFFDAAAPIVTAESIDMDKAYFASRYGKGNGDDYLNCPMDRPQYHAFWEELTKAETAELHGFEDDKVFEGCMPVETMARRGVDTLRYGPMKPVGLNLPDGTRPYAVVQLRREDNEGRMYNLVGFQTHLKFGEQRRVFGMIPGLEHAEFARYGVMHKNAFVQGPKVLNRYYECKARPGLYLAGQITGVEGYVESTASGLLAGLCAVCDVLGQARPLLSQDTAIGALAAYVSGYAGADFQPMNITYGLINTIEAKAKSDKKRMVAERALAEVRRVAATCKGDMI
jgi:methylenetetrahydrofolate--tRNA-(uracil-5-)-methyltransferase